MSTLLQENLAKEIILQQKHKTRAFKKDLLVKAGYGKVTAEANPEKIIKRKGVLEALEKYGFTIERADNQVTRILHEGREENRLRAADMVYSRLNAYAPEKHLNVNLNASMKELSTEELEKLANSGEKAENEALQAP